MKITDVRITLERNNLHSRKLPKIVARAVITLEETILVNGFVIVSGDGLVVGFPADFLPDAVMHCKVETAILDSYHKIRGDEI